MIELRDAFPDAAPPTGARDRVRAALPARIERARRRRARTAHGAVVGVAMMSIAVIALTRDPRVERVTARPAAIDASAAPVITTTGAPLAPGLLVLPSGARVVLRPGSRASLVRDDGAATILRLDAGTLAAHVEKRPANRPFVVEAGAARVEVVGTVFVVERAAGAAPTVTGIEGIVRVIAPGSRAAPALVRAGDVWPSTASPVALRPDEVTLLAFEASPPPAVVPIAPAGAPRPHATQRRAPTEPAAPSAAEPAAPSAAAPAAATPAAAATAPLAAEPPTSFAAARALEEAGAIAAALRAYRVLADGDDALAQDALYAVGRLQRGRAGATWREYRRRFPDGRYARAVDLQLLELAIAAADWALVVSEADAFLAAHGGDARAPRFRRARASAAARIKNAVLEETHRP